MSTIVIALLAMSGLGVLFGVGLALASRAFTLNEDPRLEPVLDALPGVNCGACAYAGCRSYAEAVVAGENVGLCTVGGEEVAQALAAIMGVEVSQAARKRAVVHCQGGVGRCGDAFEYVGEPDCRAAHITAGGQKACAYGCLGFGTCAEACPFDAITMSEERLPVVDPDRCTGCGMCVRVCPRDLISLLEVDYTTYLGCSSRDRGKAVKNVCSVGCIACGVCAKKDPNGAIEMKDNLPVLDFEKSQGDFATGAEVCPMNCFVVEQKGQPELAAARSSEAES